MTDYLNRACEYLGVEPGSAINPRVEGDEFVVIIDRGIAGCPFYRIPLSELPELKSERVAVDVALADPVDADSGLPNMPYRDLQVLALAAGIPANQSADALRAALDAFDEEE